MFFLEPLKNALGGMTLSPQQAKTACRGPRCLAGLVLSSFKMASITPSHGPSLGHIGIPGIFDAERHFYLERRGEGTDLIQSEEFTGLLAGRLTAVILRETAAQMSGMNSALKQRTELLVQRPVNIGVR
jgi:hypothetical protein